MKYVIVESQSASELQTKVQQHLDKGWQLQGGIAVATYGAGMWWYYQVVVFQTAAQ